jgi:hypothetical protein
MSDKALVKLDITLLAAWLVLAAVRTTRVSLAPATRAVLMNSLVRVAFEEDALKLWLML